MVRVEDTIHSHHYYVDAAKAAIEIYIALYDKPKTTVVGGQEIDLESLSEAEKKKALSKLKKQQAIAAATQKETAAASAEVKKAAAAAATAKETDGQKFVETTDPLGEAIKFLQPLQTQVPHLIDTHLLAFEIYIRRGKLLLALNAIKKAIAIDANHPVVHKDIVRFHVALQARKDLNETLKKVLVDESAGLLQGSTPQQYVADVLLKKNPQSLAHAIAAAEATVSVNAEAKAEAIKYITAFKAEQLTLKQAIKVHAALQAIAGESSATAQDFKAQAHKHFSLATYFKPAKSS